MSLQAKILVTLKSQYRSIAMDDWEMFLTCIYTICVYAIPITFLASLAIFRVRDLGRWESCLFCLLSFFTWEMEPKINLFPRNKEEYLIGCCFCIHQTKSQMIFGVMTPFFKSRHKSSLLTANSLSYHLEKQIGTFEFIFFSVLP